MQTDHPYIGVDAIIRNDKGEILLMHRTRGVYKQLWGLIAGKVEWGEEIEDALKREVMEEICVEIGNIRFTGRYYDKIGRHPTKTMICLPHFCDIISGTPSAVSECDEVKWFKPEEIREMDLAYDHKQMLDDLKLI